MEVASLPSHNPLRLCFGRLSGSVFPSSLTFCAYKGQYIGCYPYKWATVKNSHISALNGLPCIPRKLVGVPWHYCLKEEYSQPYLGCKVHSQNKLSRHTVVRSECVGSGLPDSAHPLSDTELVSKVRGMFFYAVTVISAIFLFVLMVIQHPFVLLLDRCRRRAHQFIAQIWATLTVTPFFKIEYEGLENLPPGDSPAVYVSNHQSFLDIYTLLTLGRNFKFISKTGIFLFPIIGWAMFMMGVIPLKRTDSRSQLDCLKRCMDLIKKGASVFFFPEGTRSKDGKLGPFKKGAFSLAAKTRVPVVPMTLIGTGNIMPAGMEGMLNSGTVKVVIHKPIQGSEPGMMCNEARTAIANVLNQQS